MTANETYQSKREEINARIAVLQAGLEVMDDLQSQNPKDWGFVGNAGHIMDALNDLMEFVEVPVELWK